MMHCIARTITETLRRDLMALDCLVVVEPDYFDSSKGFQAFEQGRISRAPRPLRHRKE